MIREHRHVPSVKEILTPENEGAMISRLITFQEIQARMFNWIMITCNLALLFMRKLKRKGDGEKRIKIRRSRIGSFTRSLCPPRITKEEPRSHRCPEYNNIDDQPQIPYQEREQPNKAGKPTGTRSQPMGDGRLGTCDTSGINTPLKTTPPIIGTEQKSSEMGDVGAKNPWNDNGSAKYPGSFRPGRNPWRSLRESEYRKYPYPMAIGETRSTSTQFEPLDNTQRHRYSRSGTKETPDIGPSAEKDRSKVRRGAYNLFRNCQPRTPIRNQGLKDKDPKLTCLGGENKGNYWRRGQESPQLGTRPGPNNQREPDVLRPHITERATSKNPRMGSLGNCTYTQEITNRSNKLVSNKVSRPGKGTYQSLVEILGMSPRLKTSLKAQAISKKLARLRAAQVASFEAGGFIWIN